VLRGFLAAGLEDVGGLGGDLRRVVVRQGSEVGGHRLGHGWPTGGGRGPSGGAVEAGEGEKEEARGEQGRGGGGHVEAEAVA
jgi:hypothetical protein